MVRYRRPPSAWVPRIGAAQKEARRTPSGKTGIAKAEPE